MTDTRRYLAMDGLRGIAAGTVLAHHIGIASGHPIPFTHGYLAVDLFFMLSGFVIGAAYEHKMREARCAVCFMLKTRLLRLYPMMVLGTLFGLLVVEIHVRPMPSVPIWLALLRQLTFWPTLTPHSELFLLDGVEWSLMLELGTNLLHAAVLRWLSLRVLGAIIFISLAAVIGLGHHYGSLGTGWGADNIWGGVARVAFSYTVGLTIFRLHAMGKLARITLAKLFVIAAVPAGILLAQEIPGSFLIKDLTNALILYPLLVWSAVSMKLDGIFARMAKIGGDISYPLYTFQSPLAWLFEVGIAAHLGSRAAHWIGWTCFVGAICLLSWAAFVFVDAPIRKKLGQLLHSRIREVAATVP